MKNDKKTLLLSGIAIITLIVFVVGATYAFFRAQNGNTTDTPLNVTTATTDSLIFSVGDAINISADMTNFASGAGNLSDTTTASAILKANSATNNATANYYLYFEITKNELMYTTEAKSAELLLKVTDPEGNEVTSLDGLTYVTSGGVTGFDITTASGIITIAKNYEIVSTGTKTDTWNIEVIFVNLESDQHANEGKSFAGEVRIQKDVDIRTLSIADVCVGENMASCIAKNYTLDNAIYYHNENLANSANDGSYRYAGGDYQLTSTATTAGYSTLIDSSASETTGLIKFYCNGSAQYVGYGCNASYAHYYTVAGGTTQYSTYNEALVAAVSQGYLTQDNVKNFVCFGSDASQCPTDNLYRIIGIIDGQVKLIKYDYASSDLLGTDGDYSQNYSYWFSGARSDNQGTTDLYYWNYANKDAAYNETGYYNVWSYSQLNTVNLNTNYINNIGTKWANMIAETTWSVGGNTSANIASSSASTAYQNEILNPDSTIETTYEAKIGLMYASDYGYATDPNNWTTNLGSYDGAASKSTNWVYMGKWDWTISRTSVSTNYAFFVNGTGDVHNYYVYYCDYGVRPSFYLESSVIITGGTGIASDPYRIS